MKPTFRVLEAVLEPAGRRDEAGRLVLGNPEQGCRYCGEIGIKVAENDRLVLYHPGAECCARAVADQLRYRQLALENLRKRMEARQEHLGQLEEEARLYDPTSRATEATRAWAIYERAKANFDDATEPLREEIKTTTGEIRRLEARLTRMRSTR